MSTKVSASSANNMAKKAKQAAIQDMIESKEPVMFKSQIETTSLFQTRTLTLDEEGYYGTLPTVEMKNQLIAK